MTKNRKKGTFMMKKWNRRQRLVLWLALSLIFLAAVCIGGMFCGDAARETDFARKNIAPCLKYPFGTDWLGRDMFTRTVKGTFHQHYHWNQRRGFQRGDGLYSGRSVRNNGKSCRYSYHLVY